MAILDYALLIIAVSVAVLVYHVSRLTRRLERSAQVMDDLVATVRHETELTMAAARGAITQMHEAGASANVVLKQLGTVSTSVQDQVKKIEKVVSVAEGVMDGLRVNALLFEKVVASPLAKVTGAWAGLARGVRVLRRIRSKGEKA